MPASLLTIYLQNLRFNAYHGVFDEEKLVGGAFEVNVMVYFHPATAPVTRLDQTINYAAVYQMVKEAMNTPCAILETVATETAHAILNRFKLAEEVEISITKLHPPVVGMQGSVGVRYKLAR